MEFLSLETMTISRAASKTQADATPTAYATFLALFLPFPFMFYYSLRPRYVSYLSAVCLPSPSDYARLQRRRKSSAQDRSPPERNGFCVCNSHGFELNALGRSADCSPKNCLSFNTSAHEYCMAAGWGRPGDEKSLHGLVMERVAKWGKSSA